MRAAVVGLGKIGLPLAVQIAGSGVEVIGADNNRDVVDMVNSGVPPFPGEPNLDERLNSCLRAGTLEATVSTPRAVAESDVVIVLVPLAVDHTGAAEFSGIDAATEEIGGALRNGQLVVYETTLPIGTTRERFGPILERASGLSVGEDFLLAFSPERVSSGSMFADLRSYPKLVGGVNPMSARRAEEFYHDVLQFDERPDLSRPNGVWNMGTCETAEFVKLAETTYRDVNIALANEFAANAEARGLNVWSVIEAANSQPYSHIHRPGIAVGGHCIPIYPRFYLAGHTEARVPAVSRAVNDDQPRRSVARLVSTMGSIRDKRIAILGAAYRGGVKETAFSGVFAVVDAIIENGGVPCVHDPLFTDEELRWIGFTPYAIGSAIDAVIVQTDHSEYANLSPEDLPGCTAVLDGRGVLRGVDWIDSQIPLLRIGIAAGGNQV